MPIFTKKLSETEVDSLLKTLKNRFTKSMSRHDKLSWDAVSEHLRSHNQKLSVLANMELSGGEPDVVGVDRQSGEYVFFDCSAESPSGRRSLCYDKTALESRKEFKPKTSVIDMVDAIGAELLTEEQYLELQNLGNFDEKTSSWIVTPSEVRELGGALFADRRYNRVFIFHNGAESYYASRGFRCCFKI